MNYKINISHSRNTTLEDWWSTRILACGRDTIVCFSLLTCLLWILCFRNVWIVACSIVEHATAISILARRRSTCPSLYRSVLRVMTMSVWSFSFSIMTSTLRTLEEKRLRTIWCVIMLLHWVSIVGISVSMRLVCYYAP